MSECEALAAAIETAKHAAAELDRVHAPAVRFSTAERTAVAARKRVDDLQAADAETVARWLAEGGGSPRPAPPAELAAAEQALHEAERDARAARLASDRIQAHIEIAAQRAWQAAQRRDEILCQTAVAEARRIAEAEIGPLVGQLLYWNRRVRGIASALQAIGDRPNEPSGTAALNAGAQVMVIANDAMKANAYGHDAAAGEDFLRRLRVDADAHL